MRTGTCPLWGTPAQLEDPRGDGTTAISPRAGGKFSIVGSAQAMMSNLDERGKANITFWMVKQRSVGVECPSIDSENLKVLTSYPRISVFERADYLLQYIEGKSDLLGHVEKFYTLDNEKNPDLVRELLAWSGSIKLTEVITLVEYCHKLGWFEHKIVERAGASHNTAHEVMLTPAGYARLAELRGTNSTSQQGFVAMWLDPSMNDAYTNGIRPAIVDAGYSALRIDDKEHIGKIDDAIIAEIRRSRFLVADFTCGTGIPTGSTEVTGISRGSVYYEAGFAQGLNIPVIWCCRKTSMRDLQFDTRQFNHIVWEDINDLKKQLQKRIEAVIGDGPLRRT